MQINLKELSTQAIESTTGTKKMRLSENAQSMVFQLFTKNVYSNPIGTVVREITSNCFDSHIEANTMKSPVVIKRFIDKQTNTQYISFIDYGVGMSPDRIDNIYGIYFESTKRVDNTQIGGFGIGGKSPLAYKRSTGQGEGEYDNSFYVITNFDGIKYCYLIFEGADTPVISLLHQEETLEHNGTEVRIPILDKDLEAFSKEMIRQLYYFENIIFEGFKDVWKYGETLTNHYQIIKGKTFLFRGTDYSNSMHICLGRVAYPIDYNTLGLSSNEYNIPIAIKLEVGEIGVTVSRESLDYSESTIKILKKKLIEAKAEIIEMISKQYKNIVTLEDYFNVKNDFGQLKFNAKMSMYVGNLIKQTDIDFSNFKYSLNFLKMPNDKQLFKLFFDIKTYGKKPKRSRYNRNEFEGGYSELQKNTNLLYITGEFERKVIKQSYLKSVFEQYYIISKRNLIDSKIKFEISELFNVHLSDLLDTNGKAVPYIQSLLEMQNEYFTIVQNHAKDYDLVIIPDDFIIARKRRDILSPEIRNSTIPIKFIGGSKDRVIVDMLLKYEMPIFYGTAEEEHKLIRAYQLYDLLFNSKLRVTGFYDNEFIRSGENRYSYNYSTKKQNDLKGSIMFIMLANNNIKYMKYCKNAFHVDNFYLKMLYRKTDIVKQYFQVYNLIEKYDNLRKLYTDEHFDKLNILWANKINEVNAFVNAIPVKAKDNEIARNKSSLEHYFGSLANIPMSKEQQRIIKIIDELKQLELKNNESLKYISGLYNLNDANNILVDILKKIMIF